MVVVGQASVRRPAKSSTPSWSCRAAAFTTTASTSSGAPFTHSSGQARTSTSIGCRMSATWSVTCLSPTWVNGQVMSAKTSRAIPPMVWVTDRRQASRDRLRAPPGPGRTALRPDPRSLVQLLDEALLATVLDEQARRLLDPALVAGVGELPVVELVHLVHRVHADQPGDVGETAVVRLEEHRLGAERRSHVVRHLHTELDRFGVLTRRHGGPGDPPEPARLALERGAEDASDRVLRRRHEQAAHGAHHRQVDGIGQHLLGHLLQLDHRIDAPAPHDGAQRCAEAGAEHVEFGTADLGHLLGDCQCGGHGLELLAEGGDRAAVAFIHGWFLPGWCDVRPFTVLRWWGTVHDLDHTAAPRGGDRSGSTEGSWG